MSYDPPTELEQLRRDMDNVNAVLLEISETLKQILRILDRDRKFIEIDK